MDQLLILFIAIPMLAFFATLLWQNKSEKAIGKIPYCWCFLILFGCNVQ